MTTRSLMLWIALQTLLGSWFLWLLLAGSPIAPPRADASDSSRRAHTEAAVAEGTNVLGAEPHRELATPEAVIDSAMDPVGVLLFGRIRDEQGNPVDQALLSIRQQDQHKGACETEASGTYSLAGLLPGEADLLVRTPGYRNLRDALQLTRPAQRHDLVLRRAVVLQVIGRTPTGEPLTAAMQALALDNRIQLRAIATREPTPSLSGDVRRIGIGRYQHARWYGEVKIEGASDDLLGTLEIDGELPVHVSLIVGSAVLASQVVQPGEERVVFSLTPQAVREQLASVRLQLVAATTGRPLVAVRVEGPGVKITDAEGVAEFVDVAPGPHRLKTLGAKHELDQLIQLEPGQQLDLGRVTLHELQIVSGVILDTNGQPTPATLAWHDLDEQAFAQPLRDDRTAGSDAQGKWQLRLAPHRYALHASSREGDHHAHLLLDLSQGVPEDISLRLQPTVQVELVKEFAASRSYLLSIRTSDGMPVFGRFTRAGFAQSIRLPAGEYVGELHEGRILVRSFGLTVGNTKTRIHIP